MIQVALSKLFLERWGARIRDAAPGEIELVAVEDAPEGGLDAAEILFKSEFEKDLPVREVVARMPRLRWLHSIYAGTNDIPWVLITPRGIVVTNSAGVYAPMMAEYVIGMLVMLYRNLHLHALAQREHRQPKVQSLEPNAQELFGKRMGILGYGAIGRRLAHVASGMGMRVWALRRTPTIEANEPVERMLGAGDLDVLLRECDIVVITASLNSTTRGLLGTAEFKKMKPNAVLVNVARGAILDEDALVQALKEGWLRGAILDVTTVEPLPPESPLWDAPNLLITPHISGEMPIGRERSVDLFCKNLRLYLDGQLSSMGNRVDAATHV